MIGDIGKPQKRHSKTARALQGQGMGHNTKFTTVKRGKGFQDGNQELGFAKYYSRFSNRNSSQSKYLDPPRDSLNRLWRTYSR